MKRIGIPIAFATTVLVYSSCATLLSSRQTNFNVLTSKPSMLIVEQDTFKNMTQRRSVTADRSHHPLTITAFTDSLTKTATIMPRMNPVSWLNIYFWPFFIVDGNTEKGYTYPQTVFIDFADQNNDYLTYNPYDDAFKKQNVLKINVGSLLNPVSPALSLNYERKTGKHFSTQLSAAYLLPENPWIGYSGVGSDIKGFWVAVEEKYYFLEHALHRSYLGLEARFFNKDYRAIEWFYQEPNTQEQYEWYEDAIGIHKQVYDFNIKYGYLLRFKRFSVDLSIGLGVKHRNVVHTDRVNPADRMVNPRHPNVYHIANKAGKYWTVGVPMNIGIGWAF